MAITRYLKLSLQMACPRLTEISLTDWGPYPVLKLLQGISRAEYIKRITLLNYNTGNAVNPGIPSITVLNSFPQLEEFDNPWPMFPGILSSCPFIFVEQHHFLQILEYRNEPILCLMQEMISDEIAKFEDGVL